VRRRLGFRGHVYAENPHGRFARAAVFIFNAHKHGGGRGATNRKQDIVIINNLRFQSTIQRFSSESSGSRESPEYSCVSSQVVF
jgi:hypothetical protein